MRHKKSIAIKVVGTAVALSACSLGHHGGSGSTGAQGPSPADPNATYVLDASGMNNGGQELTYAAKPVSWTTRVVIDGVESLSLQNVTFAAVQSAFQKTRVTESQDLKVEFTLTGTSSAGKATILATNLSGVAAADPVLNALWETGCSNVGTELALFDDQSVNAATDSVTVKMPLCDFQKILVNPTVAVLPANNVVDTRHIVYTCEAGNYGLDIAYMAGSGTCAAGYELPPLYNGKAMIDHDHFSGIKMEQPVGATVSFNATGNVDLKSSASSLASYKYTFSDDDFSGMVLSDFEHCNTIEFSLPYQDSPGAGNGLKEARVSFTRAVDPSTGVTSWNPYDQTSLPPLAMVTNQTISVLKFYLFCTWVNPTGLPVAQIDPTRI